MGLQTFRRGGRLLDEGGILLRHAVERRDGFFDVADSVALVARAGVALETSIANAGQASPRYSTQWAAPGIPLKALKWLFQRHAPLCIRPDGSLRQLRWLAQMLGQCTNASYSLNKEPMMRLAEYSCDSLRSTGLATNGCCLARPRHLSPAHRRPITIAAESGLSRVRSRRPIKRDHARSPKAKVMLQGDAGFVNLTPLCTAAQLVS